MLGGMNKGLPVSPARSSTLPDPRIDGELIRLVVGGWSQYVDGIPFAVLLSLVMSGVFPAIGHTPILGTLPWLAAQAVWSIAALALWHRYTVSHAEHSCEFWHRRLIALWAAH